MEYATKNSKYRCLACGSTVDRPLSVFGPGACTNCGGHGWERVTTHPLCDFCGTEDPPWAFPCEAFPMSTAGFIPAEVGPTQMSEGDWSACDTCKELVEADQLTELARRATKVFLTKNPGARKDRRVVEAANRASHRSFLAHRTGPARRI